MRFCLCIHWNLLVRLAVTHWNILYVQTGKSVRDDASEIPPAPFSNECRLIFNEINLFSAKELQFVEITRFCETETNNRNLINMDKYKILFVDPEGYLIGVCQLRDTFQVTIGFFYVLGMEKVDNVNIETSECQLSIFQPRTVFPTMQIRLPMGIDEPFGLLLVRNDRTSVLHDLKLINDGVNYRSVKLTTQMEKTIIKNLQDYYIVGASTRIVYCDYFRRFYTRYTLSPTVMLRDWDNQGAEIEYSINRCAETNHVGYTLPMKPEFMKYSLITPGIDNACTEAFFHHVEPQISQPRVLQNNCYSYFQSVQADLEFVTHPQNYRNNIRAAQARTQETLESDHMDIELQTNISSIVNQSMETNVVIGNSSLNLTGRRRGKKRVVFNVNPINTTTFENEMTTDMPYLWNDCSRFSSTYWNDIQSLKQQTLRVEDIMVKNICNWIEYVKPGHKIRCRLCRKLFQQGILVERPGNIPLIITDGVGDLVLEDAMSVSLAKQGNMKLIMDHLVHPLHIQALDFFKIFDSGKRSTELKQAFERESGPFRKFIKATENVVISALQSSRMGISYNNFKIMAETLEYFNVPISHLYRNPTGMSSSLQVISQTMHQDLLQNLLFNQPELSISIDTATDVAGYSSMAIIFNTYSANKTLQTYLYRIVHMPDGETGIKLFNMFLDCLKKDGIENYVKNKIVALTTDGHPALLSVFRKLLNNFAANEIVGIHCTCHRLELVMKRSYDSIDYVKFIDDSINKLFRFFSAKSAKRNDVLRYEIKTFGVKLFTLKRIQRIRWVNSKVRAISPIITRYRPIINSLERIAADRTERLQVREKADNLLEIFKTPQFLATIAFLLDINTEISELSKLLQTRGNTVIGKKSMRQELTRSLIALKSTVGPNLEVLLANSELQADDEGCNEITLHMFETMEIKYCQIALNPPNANFSENNLSQQIHQYVDAVVLNLQNYFPEDVEDYMEIFWLNNLPNMSVNVGTYGQSEICELNRKLKWGYNDTNLKADWKVLIESLLNHPEFLARKTDTPEDFWNFFLVNSNGINWTAITTEIVKKVITVQSNSAENERIFSMYSYTKTLRRFNLLPSSVEHIVRIRYNSKKDLKEFDTLKYAKAMLKVHSRSDDITRRLTWKKRKYDGELVTSKPFTQNIVNQTVTTFESEEVANDASYDSEEGESSTDTENSDEQALNSYEDER